MSAFSQHESWQANKILTAEERVKAFQNRAKEELKSVAEGTGKIVIIDFILGILMVFVTIPVFGMPFAALVILLAVVYKSTKKAKYELAQSNVYIGVFILGALFIMISSVMGNDIDFINALQRIVRMISVVFLALFIAERRIDLKSLILGLSSMMLVNAVLFFAGVAPANYGQYLTGWLSDKNVAGLYHAIVPIIMFALYTKTWQRLLIIGIGFPLLFATGSRTSLGAFGIALLWYFFAQKLNLFFKLFLAGFVGWFFEWLQNNFADSAVFGDRTGTDWFREQIDKASWAKVQETPWYGQGLGQAYASVPGHNNQYFHNSFWTLFVEGGWPWTILVLAITLAVALFWKQPRPQRLVVGEAAIIVIAICSWRLGEVFLTAPWGLAMGVALSLLAVPINSAQQFRYVQSRR